MNNYGTFESFVAHGGLSPVDGAVADDLFLTCASFEERCTGVAQCMIGNYKVKRSAIYVNSEFKGLARTRENILNVESKLRIVSSDYSGIRVGSWADSVEQFRVLRELIAPRGVNKDVVRVTLDITTFNRESLLSCLALLRWAYPNGLIRLAYVSPKEYNPVGKMVIKALEEEVGGHTKHLDATDINKHLWLSRGFRCLRNAIGFPGLQRQNLPALLILLPGYEIERALTIVNAIEPVKVMLGKPTDATRDVFYERSLDAKAQMVSLFKSRQPVFEFDFSCKCVEATIEAIAEIAKNHYDTHNIYVTSLSTKPTLIALFLTVLKFSRIQITCSVPRDYNIDDYSIGTHEVSFFMLPKV